MQAWLSPTVNASTIQSSPVPPARFLGYYIRCTLCSSPPPLQPLNPEQIHHTYHKMPSDLWYVVLGLLSRRVCAEGYHQLAFLGCCIPADLWQRFKALQNADMTVYSPVYAVSLALPPMSISTPKYVIIRLRTAPCSPIFISARAALSQHSIAILAYSIYNEQKLTYM